MKEKKQCLNPICVQSFNVMTALNEYYAENPKARITCKQFMDLQYVIWQNVKKELKIKTK